MTDKLLSAVELAAQHTDAEKFKAFEWLRELALSSSADAPVARVAFDTWAGLMVPIDMVLHCPNCGTQHIDYSEADAGGAEDAWDNPPHRSHLCHGCGHVWRPADVPTNGVAAVKTAGKNDSPIATKAAPEPVAHAHVYSDWIGTKGNEQAVRRFKVVFVDSDWQYRQPDGATIPMYTAPPPAPLREPPEWLPIEIAPKDGTAVLVMRNIWPGTATGFAEDCNGHNTYVAAWWTNRWVCYMDWIEDPTCPIKPTHWMPLPAAPTHPAQAEKKETP